MQDAQFVAPLGLLQTNSVFPVQKVSAHMGQWVSYGTYGAYGHWVPIHLEYYQLYQIKSTWRMQDAKTVAPLGPLQANSVFPVQMVSAHAASGSD